MKCSQPSRRRTACLEGRPGTAGRNAGSAGGEVDPYGLDPGQDLGAQAVRPPFLPAGPGDGPLVDPLKAVLAQAGTAFVEMDLDLRARSRVDLAVKVGIDPVEHLGTG